MESSQWQPLIAKIVQADVGHKLLPQIFPAPSAMASWGLKEDISQFKFLEHVLADREWLLGQRISLADYLVAAMTTYFKVSNFPFISYPNISLWLNQLSQKIGWQKTGNPIWQ